MTNAEKNIIQSLEYTALAAESFIREYKRLKKEMENPSSKPSKSKVKMAHLIANRRRAIDRSIIKHQAQKQAI